MKRFSFQGYLKKARKYARIKENFGVIFVKKYLKKMLLYIVGTLFLPHLKEGNCVLITATDGIGDNIVRLCILEKMLTMFGKERCYILCENKTKDFMKKIGFQHIIVFEPEHRKRVMGKFNLLKKIFQIPLQEIVSLEFDQHDFPIEFFSNTSTTGYDNIFHPEINQYYKRSIENKSGNIENAVLHFYNEYFQEKLSIEEILPDITKYYRGVEEIKGVMTVGIGAGDRYKIMAPSVLGKILQRMIEIKKLHQVILLGFGPKEQKYVEELRKYISFERYYVDTKVGKLSFEETIAEIQKSQYYLGMDSGLFHVAASLQKTTFGLFTKKNPFSHESWKNVTVFYGKESQIENYYGNPFLNGIDIELIEKMIV